MSSADSPNRTRRTFRRLMGPTADGRNDNQPNARLSSPTKDDDEPPPPLSTASPPRPARSLQQFQQRSTPTATTPRSGVSPPPASSSSSRHHHHQPQHTIAVPHQSVQHGGVSSSFSSSSSAAAEISKAGSFVVTDAVVAMVLVEGRTDRDSTVLPSAVWTADESAWIRIRDPATGDVTRQWRLRGGRSDERRQQQQSSQRSPTPMSTNGGGASAGGSVNVTTMWASPRHVPSQFAVVLVGRDDGVISAFSAATAAHLADLALHEGLVSAFAVCDAEASRVASCGFDGRVALWDVRSLRCVTSTTVLAPKAGGATALLCMSAFPVAAGGAASSSSSSSSAPTWWIAVGGHHGALYVYRAADLTTIAREENSARENALHDTKRDNSPPRRLEGAAAELDGRNPSSASSSSPSDLFAMTAMVCVPRSSELTGTKHIWCGFSDGTVVLYSAALSTGVDRVQQVSVSSSRRPAGAGVSSSPSISHMSEPGDGDDRVWVFTVDGYLSIFDSNRRVVLQRIPATASASSTSLRHQQQQSSSTAWRRKDLLTCISPIAVSRVWRIWTACEDGTVTVWNSQSPDMGMGMAVASSMQQAQHHQQRRDVSPSSIRSALLVEETTPNGGGGGGGGGLPQQHSVQIQEVELLRAKLVDCRAELERAVEREHSSKKLAALDLEEATRRAADEVRAAKLAEQDAEERLSSFRRAAGTVEGQLRAEIARLEGDVARLQRRSVERAQSVQRAASVDRSSHMHQQELVSTIDSLRAQLAEARASSAAALAVATAAGHSNGSINNSNGGGGGLTSPSAVLTMQQQNQQQQQILLEQQRLALEREFELRRDREQQQSFSETAARELSDLRPRLERERARAEATALELQRKSSDFEKLLETCSQLRSSLDDMTQKTAKTEEANEFLRRELSRHGGVGLSTGVPPLTTPLRSTAAAMGGGAFVGSTPSSSQQLNFVAGRQDDLDALERTFQERQSQTIRELFELRQQLERRGLDVKAAENDLRVAKQDSEHLRNELRASMDETAKLEQRMEDAELLHERAQRDARAEERRTTEADVAGQYRGRMVELERELQAAMDRAAKLEAELHFARDELRSMEKRREAAVQRDTAHLQELQRQVASQAEALKQREQEIGRIHASAEGELQELRAGVLVAQREAEAQKRARESIEAAAKRQLATVSSEMNQVDVDVQMLHRQLHDGSATMHRAALQDEISSLKEQLSAVKREAASSRASVVQLETQMNGAQSRELAEKGETAKARAELEAAQRQQAVHREEIGSLQARLQAAQREAANALEVAEAKLRTEMDALRRQLADAQSDAIKARAESDMLNRKSLDDAARSSAEAMELKTAFARDRAEMGARIESLERELSAGSVTAQITAWQRKLEDAGAERDALREQAATLRRQLDQAERTAMAQQTELERQMQELRRSAMVERSDQQGKASVMEMDIDTLRKTVTRLRDTQKQHSRECPLGDGTVQQTIEDRRRLSVTVDELRDKESKLEGRVKTLTTDLNQMQRDMAEKEFEHLREMKVSKLESEKEIARLESQLQDAQQHITSQLNHSLGQQQRSRRNSGSGSSLIPPQPQPNPFQQQQQQQQPMIHIVENDENRQRIRELQDEADDAQRKARRAQQELEETREQLLKERASVQQLQQDLRDAQFQSQQQQLSNRELEETAASKTVSHKNEKRVLELEQTVNKMREAIARLQKEKAAIQMQLMRRDDQLRDFESNHVARMLEEVNALRLARDKALLDCNRLTGDVQQLQTQLRNESQVRTQLSGRVESNQAHVTTVHGSLRAVMLEAASREQQLERTIMKMQQSLKQVIDEKSTVEATASATEQAAVGTTVRALQMAEAHVARLLQSMLLLLELARDRPKDTLDTVAHTVIGAVETATQALQYIRSEMGTVAVPLLAASGSAQRQQQHQQQSPVPPARMVVDDAENLRPSSTPMLFTAAGKQQQQQHQLAAPPPPLQQHQQHVDPASPAPSSFFPVVGTNGLHSALTPRGAMNQQQQQNRINASSVSATDLFAEAAAAKPRSGWR